MQSTSSTLSVVLVASMRATRPGAEAGDAKVVDDYVGSKAAELEKKEEKAGWEDWDDIDGTL